MTNSSSQPCEIGARIECGQYFGTVKYIGPIEGQPSIWLGIEWDNPERGKHNGSVKGVQYFTTKTLTSGSFVRPEKVNFGRSALASIESRYGSLEDERTSKLNQQNQLLIRQNMNAPFLEMVGFDKIFNKQSDFTSLKIVNLRNQNVHTGGPEFKLGMTCPNIEELDISKNLFVSWLDILEICKELKKIHWLNVSENALIMPQSWHGDKYPNLRTLICGSMKLSWGHILQIAQIFHNIEELRAPYNHIEELSDVGDSFKNLKLLDLEGNKIEEWSQICKLGTLPLLEQLIVENIGLKCIEFEGSQPKVLVFVLLKKLCLVNNSLCEWKSIGELNRLQNLNNLKISKNPITEEDKDSAHQIIIANIANLSILNGVEIERTERRGAEYDYIKKYGLEWLAVKGTEQEAQFLKSHNRYLELLEMHGEPEMSELLIKSKIIKSSLIELDVVFEDLTIQRKLPPAITVQKLMMMIQKIFCLDERPRLTYVSRTDPHIEFVLEDEMKEIGLYSMQDGDQIIVRK